MSNRVRTQGVNIRLTDQEKKRLLRNARRCKLSVSEYIRQLVNDREPIELPSDRFYELCWQMEQQLDAGSADKERLKQLLGKLRKIYEEQTDGNHEDMARS